MTRSRDLDTVAPDDQIETKRESPIITSTKTDFGSNRNESAIKNEKVTTNVDEISELTDKVYSIAGHTKHPFSAFLVNPDVFNFEERDSDEKIFLVARPHWFTNVSWILTAVLLALAPSLLKFVPLIQGIPVKFQIMGVLTWYLVTFAYAFERFLSWYFDVFIVTNERVIDIDFNNLLDKKFSEAKLSMIQDITSRVSGVGQTMFNYGNVFIQTAAEVPEITFELVPNPEKIIKILQVLREDDEKKYEGREN